MGFLKTYFINALIIVIICILYIISGLGIFRFFAVGTVSFLILQLIEITIIAMCISSILLKRMNFYIDKKCENIDIKLEKIDDERITLYRETKNVLIKINEHNRELYHKLDQYKELIENSIIKNIGIDNGNKVKIKQDVQKIDNNSKKFLPNGRRKRISSDYFIHDD